MPLVPSFLAFTMTTLSPTKINFVLPRYCQSLAVDHDITINYACYFYPYRNAFPWHPYHTGHRPAIVSGSLHSSLQWWGVKRTQTAGFQNREWTTHFLFCRLSLGPRLPPFCANDIATYEWSQYLSVEYEDSIAHYLCILRI
jgi:hypothetical protein